jgi:hypothetical protein
VHKTWAISELRKLLDLQEKLGTKDSDLPTITTLVASFRQFLRIVKPQGSTLGTFGASLGITGSSGPDTKADTTDCHRNCMNNDHKPQGKSRRTPKCICGLIHWYINCPYINTSIRPSGWKPDPATEAKFEKAKKNPVTAKQLQKAAEGQSYSKPTSQTPQIQPSKALIAFDAQPYGDHQPYSMACSF